MTNIPEYRKMMGRVIVNEINFSYFICPCCKEPIKEDHIATIYGPVGGIGHLYHKACERVEGH